MKAGMFGTDGVIRLWVDYDGSVINGAWKVHYHKETDEVSCGKNGPRAQRIMDYRDDLNPGNDEYNEVIYNHQRYADRLAVAIPLADS